MNYLQLCQRLRLEAGISGNGPTSVTGQTGEMSEVVTWIDSAYNDIQARRHNWEFLRNDFTFPCVVGTSAYAITVATDLGTWKTDSFRVSLDTLNDEQWMNCLTWEEMRDFRLFGSNRYVTGQPMDFAVKPNKSIVVWPIPDDTYDINGEYWKKPAIMTTNTSEPLFPERFHMVIVWRALMLYGGFQEANAKYQHAEKEFNRLYFALESDQLPSDFSYEPLA
jgi:hypothetical protein